MNSRVMQVAEEVERIYNELDGDELVWLYDQKVGVVAQKVLTVYTPQQAIQYLAPLRLKLQGKTVIEIGAGIGWLSIMAARYCKEVFAFEADPAWSWVFARKLYTIKPPNLTWIFGNAESLVGKLHGDIALVWTRSDTDGMLAIARQFAPEVILGPKDGKRV